MSIIDLKNPRLLDDGRVMLDALFSDNNNGVYEIHIVCPNDEATKANHAKSLAGDFGVVVAIPPLSDEDYDFDVRSLRDLLLSQTDWTQGLDVPEATKTKWQPYRQALRDITDQSGFPRTVVWPEKPQ